MIIVTGGAGFIGSNIVAALNAEGHDDIVVVDDLSDGSKVANIGDLRISDYIDKDVFLDLIDGKGQIAVPAAVFHQGACSDTTETDGRFMLRNNYDYSRRLLHYCLAHAVPFIYASSAAVYGNGKVFVEDSANAAPINVYAYSKHLFDEYVRRQLAGAESQVAGLRYFNVYGPREQHKSKMASVAFHFDRQITTSGVARLFEGSGGFENGEQRRDFVSVSDVAAVNLWFREKQNVSGIFNVGTGASESFNSVANAVIKFHGHGEIEYIPFPDQLKGRYQSYTQADIGALRAAGYDADFKGVEDGVTEYLEWLHR